MSPREPAGRRAPGAARGERLTSPPPPPRAPRRLAPTGRVATRSGSQRPTRAWCGAGHPRRSLRLPHLPSSRPRQRPHTLRAPAQTQTNLSRAPRCLLPWARHVPHTHTAALAPVDPSTRDTEVPGRATLRTHCPSRPFTAPASQGSAPDVQRPRRARLPPAPPRPPARTRREGRPRRARRPLPRPAPGADTGSPPARGARGAPAPPGSTLHAAPTWGPMHPSRPAHATQPRGPGGRATART